MKAKRSRREWLLGMIGAIFGTAAAKAADRLLPGRKSAHGAEVRLTTTERTNSGLLTVSEPLEGKLEVEPTAEPGVFLVAVRDASGEVVRSSRRELLSLSMDVTQPVQARPVPLSQAVTYTYDASGYYVYGLKHTTYFPYPGGEGETRSNGGAEDNQVEGGFEACVVRSGKTCRSYQA